MTDTITALTEALRDEFKSEISFYDKIPPAISAPAVVIAPGNPFLANATHGTIQETWDVLAVVSFKDKELGVRQMRDLSLRVRRVVSELGAVWDQASGVTTFGEEAGQGQVMSVNQVRFKYPPPTKE